MGGVRNIMVRAGADFSQLSQAMTQAQGQASSFASNMTSSFARIGLAAEGIKAIGEVIVRSVEGLKEFASQAAELDGRLSSLNARLGGTAQQFIAVAQTITQGSMSKQDIIEQGASISAMLQSSIANKQQLAAATENMMKDIAIVSSATGKTQQEVSERMVSALQGHLTALNALDMGIHVTALQHTKAYQEIAGNAPWAKLTQQQQQLIMITYMNQAVTQKFGNSIVQDTATRLNQFNAALSNIKTNLEQAFQPIMYAVLPYLTTFINYINTALEYVTAFFQVLFGYSGAKIQPVNDAINGQAAAVNNLANAHKNLNSATGGSVSTKAPKVGSGSHALRGNGAGTVGGGKKLGTGFVASFDQVHTIPEASGSGSSGSGGGSGAGVGAGGVGGVPSGLIPSIPSAITDQANAAAAVLEGLKAKVQGWVDAVKNFLAPVGKIFMDIWGAISSYFKGVVANLEAWWKQWGGTIVQALKNAWAIMGPIIVFIVQFIWDSIKGAIDGTIKFFEGLIEFLSGIFTGNWKAVFQGLWDMIKGGVQAVWNIFNIIFLFDGLSAIKEFAVKGLEAFAGLFDGAGGWLKNFATNIVQWIGDALGSIKRLFQGLGSDLNWEATYYEQLFKNAWNGILNGAASAWSGIKSIFVDAANWFARVVVTPIVNSFNNIVNGFSQGGIVGGLKAVLNTWIDYIDSFINGANSVIHLIPGVSASIPTIPHLANGGITSGPLLAMIGDNIGGQEVVTPLDRLQGMMASTVAHTINTVMAMQKNKGNVSGDIILNIDGRQFARIIKPFTDLEQKRVGTNLRLQTL